MVAGPLWGAGSSWLGRRVAARRLVVRLPEMLVAVTPERT
jgi:hypothetical protein